MKLIPAKTIYIIYKNVPHQNLVYLARSLNINNYISI